MIRLLFSIVFTVLFSLFSMAQEKPDSLESEREVVFSYQPSKNPDFDVVYRRRLHERRWLRLGMVLRLSGIDYDPIMTNAYSNRSRNLAGVFTLGLDRYRHKNKIDVVNGYHLGLGVDLANRFVDNPQIPERQRRDSNLDFTYWLGTFYGFYFNVSDNFSVGSTFNPNLRIAPTKRDTYNRLYIDFNLTNIYLISLRYRL